MRRSSVLPYVWMLCGSMAFAVMGTLAHALREHLDWPVIIVARAGLPLLLSLLMARLSRVRLVLWRPATLWMRSVAGSLSIVCTFYALTRMHAEDVFALTNMFPIWVAVLSWPVLGVAPAPSVWLAVASGVVGVVLILQPQIAVGDLTAVVALASSLFSAVAMLGLNRLRHIHPWAIVVHFSAVALVFAVGAVLTLGDPRQLAEALQPGPLLSLLGIGGAATLGQLCLTKAFATGEPARVSVVGLTQIVFTMLLGLLIGHELKTLTVLGIALVILPTAWVMLRRGALRREVPSEPEAPARED